MPPIVIVFLWVVLVCCAAGFAVWLMGNFIKDPAILKIGRVAIVALLLCVVFWLVWSLVGFPAFPTGAAPHRC
jgi:hypothetical protein